MATDFEKTFSDSTLEPVMYISEDSLALLAAAPREAVDSLLDLCCGSGVQGIVALRYYASSASFVDRNSRSPRFVRFNLALNCLAHKALDSNVVAIWEVVTTAADDDPQLRLSSQRDARSS